MTAPASIPALIAEARRLIAALDPFGPDFAAALAAGEAALAVGRFYRQHGPALLAVAEAAVRYTDALDDYDHTDDGDFVQQRALLTQTEAALRAAVRGEEKTNG